MSHDEKASELNRQAMAAASLIAELQSDDEALNHDMIEGETSFFEAIDAALSEMDECDLIVEGCKAVEEKLKARREKFGKRKERLRGLVEQAIVVAQLQTVKRPTATLTVKDLPPKRIVTDESQVPAEYWKRPDPVLDKAKLSKADSDVPGTALTNGTTSLQIRRT